MPDPSVPPTPPVPLSALLARDDLGLRPIAAVPDPAAVPIHWAHASEMTDPYPYLLGGELLLSAGVHIPAAGDTVAYFDAYVSRIVAAGGAALGFGLAPVHDTVPPALVAACETHGLPLLEVPPRTTFSAVARAVWQLMAQARLSELRRVTEAQQSLATAASRPDPVPSVLRQLSQRVGGWAALYGPDGTELSAAGRGPRPEVRKALAELTGVVRPSDRTAGSRAAGAAPATKEAAPRKRGQANPTPPPATGAAAPAPASATDTVAGTHLAAYALGPTPGFVLGVATTHTDQATHTIASVAAVLLTLLTGEQQTGTGAARTSALVRLLLGAEPKHVAPLLRPGPPRAYTPTPTPTPPPTPHRLRLGTALGSPSSTSPRRRTSSASSSPPTARSPPSPAGRWASVTRRPRTSGPPPTPAPPAPSPARKRPALPWSATAPAPASPSSYPTTRPRRTPVRSSNRSPTPPRWSRRCAPGCPCTAVGTARPWPSPCTATPSASASPAAPPCSAPTSTTRTSAWNSGSPYGSEPPR